jgi:hypothetical protein
MHRLIIAAFCVALSLNFARAAEDHPFITTDWADIHVKQSDCLGRAERAIGRNGFQSPGTTKSSRYGYRGQYVDAVRCAADKGFVFFIVAGPSAELTDRYVTAIKDGF